LIFNRNCIPSFATHSHQPCFQYTHGNGETFKICKDRTPYLLTRGPEHSLCGRACLSFLTRKTGNFVLFAHIRFIPSGVAGLIGILFSSFTIRAYVFLSSQFYHFQWPPSRSAFDSWIFIRSYGLPYCYRGAYHPRHESQRVKRLLRYLVYVFCHHTCFTRSP
jgi:hypothetical protein